MYVVYLDNELMSFNDTNASVCDSTGKLVLYSNGCYIETPYGAVVANSTGLNLGLMADLFCANNNGLGQYNRANSMMIIPHPDHKSLYGLFHIRTLNSFHQKDVLHTMVDMSANDGKGSTVFKNVPIIDDSISYNGLHAVRHANGRDWWIVAQKYLINRYHFALFSPDGFSNHHQDIGTKETQIGIWGAELAFSPDGSKLARFDGRHGLDVFDFDRCSGTLSNWRHAFFPGHTIESLAGLGWSADSRYLYASNNLVVRQIDTWSDDLQASAVVVAEAVFPSPSCGNADGSLGWMELGPDGILYSRPYNGQPCVHRIKHAERAGLACDYQQDYLVLEYPIRAFPHFPNFRLGPIDGSACDTLGIDNVPLAG